MSSTIYSKTDNYGLNLYGDNDPADLRDGYNGSMHTIDETLKTISTKSTAYHPPLQTPLRHRMRRSRLRPTRLTSTDRIRSSKRTSTRKPTRPT